MLFKNSGAPKYVITLQGRFGNHLHQIAAGKSLEAKGFEVRFDASSPATLRSTFSEIPLLKEYVHSRLVKGTATRSALINRCVRVTRRFVLPPHNLVVDQDPIGIDLFSLQEGGWVVGYWQRKALANILREELRVALTIKKSAPLDRLCVHVRRGDYVGLDRALDFKYYDQAIKEMQRLFPNIREIEIVGDDKVWLMENFPSYFHPESSGGTVLADFIKLTNSSNLITSASSFSWWAGMLSYGTVMAPRIWNSLSTADESVMIPNDWIRFP